MLDDQPLPVLGAGVPERVLAAHPIPADIDGIAAAAGLGAFHRHPPTSLLSLWLMGIEAAARARGLDFVPLVHEDYHLVCLKSALEEPAVQALCRVLQSPDWPALLLQLPGYQPAQPMGQVLAMSRLLAWWTYRGEKKPKAEDRTGRARPRQSAQERKPQKMSSRPLPFSSARSRRSGFQSVTPKG